MSEYGCDCYVEWIDAKINFIVFLLQEHLYSRTTRYIKQYSATSAEMPPEEVPQQSNARSTRTEPLAFYCGGHVNREATLPLQCLI